MVTLEQLPKGRVRELKGAPPSEHEATAKQFCGAETPGFVNGILAAVLAEEGRAAA